VLTALVDITARVRAGAALRESERRFAQAFNANPLDGYRLAGLLRAHPDAGHLRLIALTGYGQAEDRKKALDAGFDLHLTKPVEPARLQALIAGA
jgi:CheY-like chemotaxis protein